MGRCEPALRAGAFLDMSYSPLSWILSRCTAPSSVVGGTSHMSSSIAEIAKGTLYAHCWPSDALCKPSSLRSGCNAALGRSGIAHTV